MFGKAKKNVSLAYKEKLIADIAYYEKRIDEALHKKRFTSFEDVENSDDDSNPYTLNVGPTSFELKQREADLSNRASMTLELAMLTIMQSEVNIMVTAPDVRRPVKDQGTWLEVAAECKIDLVSFTITFYAHKPHRKFAPTRFRSVLVTLTKPAHAKELAKSVLPKQNRPNLALQVLQSYATAFRSRRTTLLELAQKYSEELRMEALPEGGYSVKFLDLLTVEWTLENMWSPIVPFCHRMKFEVEYMPKEYIHTIGKLYKQFKDPSLETSERTEVLSEIFDTCLQARGPARDLQESFESDPETTGRLHERRTTIDQEPDVPSSHIPASPKKQPKGKENTTQNPKTNMAPPKTIPKKAKKVANGKKRPNDELTSDNRMDVSKKTKANEEIGMHVAKKSKPIEKGDMVENRKGVKRGTENDQNSNAKKVRNDDRNANSKNKSGDKEQAADVDESGSSPRTLPSVSSKSIKTVSSKNEKNKEITDNTKNSKGKGRDDTDTGVKKDAKKASKTVNPKNKDPKNNVGSSQNVAKNRHETESVARSETEEGSGTSSKNLTKKADEKNDANSKNKNTEASKPSEKNNTKKSSKAIVNPKDSIASSNNEPKERQDGENVARSNTAESTSGSSKTSVKKGNAKNAKESNQEKAGSVATIKANNMKNGDSVSVASFKNVQDKDSGASAGETGVKNVTKKVNVNKNKAPSKNSKDKDIDSVASSKSGTKKAVDNIADIATNGEAHTTKNVNKTGQKNSNNGQKQKDTEKPFKKINIPDQIAEDANNKAIKQKETKQTENNKNGSKKTDINNPQATKAGTTDNKAKSAKVVQKTDQNNKVVAEKTNTKKMEDNVQNKIKNKVTKPDSEAQNKLNIDKNKKLTTVNVERTKTVVPKVTAGHDKNLNKNDPKEKNNRYEIVKTATTKNKETLKIATTKMTNTQSNENAKKLQNTNTKAALLKKQTEANILKKQTEYNTFKKFQDNAKIAQKLKTKIPMLKSKTKISSLSEKLKSDRTKIPLKSLPVFKKIVRNVPIRVSPRKLPSNLKPSSQGFSNK